ncbi:MAG: enoyl-CoA hydratase [Nitriliruptorales bacterium]|nr:enoyl-CoA hydratase [Nitriliruptorales bacterium]
MTISKSSDGEGIATVVMDDGKVNAFDIAFFRELDDVLGSCGDDAAIVLTGREGMFSAGLNTKTMATLDEDGMTDLLVQFGRTMLRVWLEPRPVVAAVNGHAIAGGTILAMACDHAVAATGDYRWGLTETTIGFPLPSWIIAIARGNVGAHHLDDLLLPGQTVGPARAVEVGFADAVAPLDQVRDAARIRALQLAGLPRTTYAETKRRLRGAAVDSVLGGIETDIRELLRRRGTATAAP